MIAATEHEYEPQPGLPEKLPESERMLWQGKPDWRALALHVFHVRALGLYFGALLAWRFATVLRAGHSVSESLVATAWVLPLAVAGIGLFLLIAWLTARTTLYTITTRRVVMRVGIALPVTVNIPFSIVESAALAARRDGSGDVPMALVAGQRASYLHLWPHVRPRHFAQPQPMLRGVNDAGAVAMILAQALSDSIGSNKTAPAATAAAPERIAGLETAHQHG